MRILLLSHYYPPELGAPQRRWAALVERFVAAGHEVAVLAPSPHYPSGRAGLLGADGTAAPLPAHLTPGSVHRGEHGEMVHRLHFREYGSGIGGRGRDQLHSAADSLVTGLRRFRGAHRPDVIITTVPGLPSLPAGLLVGAVLRRPVVVEMRDAWPDLLATRAQWNADNGNHPPPGAGTVLTALLSAAITVLQRRAAAMVTTTDAFAQVLQARGMPRVATVRHGATRRATASEREPLGNRPLRVLYAGTVGRSQGLHAAVHAAAGCAQSGTAIELRIIGDGAELPRLRALARRLAAPVTFWPPVAPSALARHYAWADSLLVCLRAWAPLRWAVPSKLYDVLATGRHVTAALSGEAASIVRESRGGHVVPPDDAAALAELWSRLARQPELLDVGDRARAWVASNADDDELAGRYLELLQEVARG